MKIGSLRARRRHGQWSGTDSPGKDAGRGRAASRCDDMKRADSQSSGTFDPGRMREAVFTSMVWVGD